MQVINQPHNTLSNSSLESQAKTQKELVETLKVQWKLLWNERFNDKLRAEGISKKDYEILKIERGTVISATRDFKVLNFKDILEKHMIEQPDRFIQPNVNVGGWNQFVKSNINTHQHHKNNLNLQEVSKKLGTPQPKKSRHGWLHAT